MKIFFFTIVFLVSSIVTINSTILDDLTSDRELILIIDMNNIDNIIDEPTTDEIKYVPIGNEWYSQRRLFFAATFSAGMSGAKDFLEEEFLFKYSFKSRNKHLFTARFFHKGFAPGAFSGNMSFFNFALLGGFGYLYKVFNNESGFFAWLDIGGSNGGFSFYTGLGVGSKTKNGFSLSLLFLQNTALFSELNFYFLFFDVMVLHGKSGINVKFNNDMVEMFYFTAGLSLGAFIKEKFKIEVGGGLSINEYSYFSGYGTVTIAVQVP